MHDTTPEGPRVLSVYDGFFSGGARALHTSVVRALATTTAQRHSALGLTHVTVREQTRQRARSDAGYRRLRSAGVPVALLRRRADAPLRADQVGRIGRLLSQADVVLTLKEQPLRSLAQVGATSVPVITCLHRSDPEHQGAALAELVDLVERGTVHRAVCCAHATQAAYHRATGIDLDRLPVIPNGVDLTRFRPSPALRAASRNELGVAGDLPVVLLSARFDPMKDVGLFLASAAELARVRPDAHVVLCGAGMSPGNRDLTALVARAFRRWDLAQEHVHLLGLREDMPRLYNAADLVVLSSAYGEAAPLSLLEGMACGAVPVTTDVGDAARMVADPRLVAPRDAAGMAATWLAALADRDEHRARIEAGRDRLGDRHCFDAYAALIDSCARPTAPSPGPSVPSPVVAAVGRHGSWLPT